MHAAVFAYAVFLGSHIPPWCWPWMLRLCGAGVRSAVYIVWGAVTDQWFQYEDLRRMYQESGLREIVLRFGHAGGHLPPAKVFFDAYKDYLRHALLLGYHVTVQPANEPNNELKDMTPEQVVTWFREFHEAAMEWFADFVAQNGPAYVGRFEVCTIPIAGYNEEPSDDAQSDKWLPVVKAMAEITEGAVAIHVYPKSLADIDGKWGLRWWLQQLPNKDFRVTECAADVSVSAADRAIIEPPMLRQMRACSRCRSVGLWVMWSDGKEFAPFWWSEAKVDMVVAVAIEPVQAVPLPAPAVTPIEPPVQPPPPPPPTYPTVRFGGLEVYDLRDRYPERGGLTFERRAPSEITEVVMHHTTGNCPQTVADAVHFLDAIDVYERTGRTDGVVYPAIPYGFAIDGQGRIYWLNGLSIAGWAQGPHNKQGLAFAWLGNFAVSAPSAAMVRAAVALWLAAAREQQRALYLLGHQEAMPGQTACPGAHWPTTKEQMVAMSQVGTAPDLVEALTGPLNVLWGWTGYLGDLAAVLAAADEKPAIVARLRQGRRECHDAVGAIKQHTGF